MKKIRVLLIILLISHPLFAIDIRFNTPVFTNDASISGNVPDGLSSEDLSYEIFNDIERELRYRLSGFSANPGNLIGAFANASIFSNHGAGQYSFGTYNRFAFTIGPMVGFRLPASYLSFSDGLIGSENTAPIDHDEPAITTYAQILNAQIGINTSAFFLRDLYLGIKIGYMNMPIDIFSFNTFSIGAMANYKLLNNRNIAAGSLQWSGISIGTGFIYQNSAISVNYPLEIAIEGRSIYVDDHEVRAGVSDTKFNLDFNINTYTIPVEVMTSIRLFSFINLAAGAGLDIGFGRADLSANGTVTTDFMDLPPGIVQISPGTVSFQINGNSGPSILNPKIMAALGLVLGQVMLDIPFTYYPLNNGINFGITIGIFL